MVQAVSHTSIRKMLEVLRVELEPRRLQREGVRSVCEFKVHS